MGFRMRKSIEVAPGIRLNVSRRGVGASVGGKHGRYSASLLGPSDRLRGHRNLGRLLPKERRRLPVLSFGSELRDAREGRTPRLLSLPGRTWGETGT